jgi:hypothetical protein
MPERLRRGVLAGLCVAGVFAGYLIVEAADVEFEITHASLDLVSAYDAAAGIIVFVFLCGALPSLVLRLFRVRSIVPYLVAGAISGPFAIHAFLFHFAETFNLFGSEPPLPSFGNLLLDALSDLPDLVAKPLHELRWVVPGAALIGLVCGGLFWLAFVWWPARRARRSVAAQ